MRNSFSFLQKLGKSLMLPIAVLPVAGILLRIGQPDLLDLQFIAAAGNAVFTNLGLLFAIGIAVGFAKENNGAAGLAAIVAYFVVTEGAKAVIVVPPEVVEGAADQTRDLLSSAYTSAAIAKLSVPVGLICGILAGSIYNRFHQVALHDVLAFFSGKRLVPIVTGFTALPIAAAVGFGWPLLESGMNSLSNLIVSSGEVGLFAYGALNRILVVSGLHHILNNLAWFLLGDFDGVTGDLRRFFAGDPSAGAFMSGFFPIMMFGLPGACFAMYRTAEQAHRAKVAGLLLSMGLTSFLTGITEPIEFAFIFIAPVLFVIHAILTGVSMVVMDLLDVRLGFGFSAGFFDYALNFDKASNPLMLWPIGVVYFLIYFLTFRFFILKFDLKTLGRGQLFVNKSNADSSNSGDLESLEFIEALGGNQNLLVIDSCMTRLRLDVEDSNAIDEEKLRALGAAGVVKPSPKTLQVIVGLRADEIASGIRANLSATESIHSFNGHTQKSTSSAVDNSMSTSNSAPSEVDVQNLVDALGGKQNLLEFRSFGSRLRLKFKHANKACNATLLQLGYRGLAISKNETAYLISEHDTQLLDDALHRLMEGK